MTPVKKMVSKFTMDSPQQLAQNEEANRMGSALAARMSVGSWSTNRWKAESTHEMMSSSVFPAGGSPGPLRGSKSSQPYSVNVSNIVAKRK